MKTRLADRHKAGKQLESLVIKLGVEELAKRFNVSKGTIQNWMGLTVPKTKCVDIERMHIAEFGY